VAVHEDKVHGVLAVITFKAASQISQEEITDKINEILARYPVRYKVVPG
jgi:hypothetical protein